jgi:sec-independent protein translocase protein TatC
MPIGPQRMPFLSHLAELRHRFIVIALSISIGAMVCYMFTGNIMDWLFEPIAPYIANQALNVFGPFEMFIFRFKVASYAAIIITSPIWLYQILAFFLPALKQNERKYFIPTFIAILVLFIAGNLFCHYLVLGVSFQWLLSQNSGGIDFAQLWYPIAKFLHGFIPAIQAVPPPPPTFTIKLESIAGASQFLNGVAIFMLAFGFTFELPVLLFFLLATGVVKYAVLRRNWRYMYLGLIAFSSLTTPDWSPVTILVLFLASVGLYEGTMLVARFALAGKIREQAAEAKAA